VYRDIVECSQAGDGPATAPVSNWGRGPAQQHASAGSAADALNALAVLQEWLQESPLVFI